MRRAVVGFGLAIGTGCAQPCSDSDPAGTTSINDWHVTASGAMDLYGSAVEGGVALVVGDAGTILQSSDGGEQWSASASGVGVTLYGVARSEGRAWAAGDQGTLLVNEGSGWAPVTGLETALPLYGVSAAGDVVAAVGDQTTWVTFDGGGEWRDIGGAWRVRGVQVRSEAAMYAVGDDGLFMRWNEITWVPRATGTEASLRAVAFASDTEGVAVGMGGVVLFSSDSGDTWTAASNPPPDDLYGVTVAASTYLAVGAGGTVWRSGDGGDTWSSLYESGVERLTDIDGFDDATMLGTQFLAPGFGGDVAIYGSREAEDTASGWGECG